MERRIERIETTLPPEPGFIGAGHTAVEVLAPRTLAASDPFVLLMDDRLDIPVRRRIGGAHPHAGLETVTLVLEGTLHDRDEGELSAGDVLWMTAGRGIVHNEDVEIEGRTRILQLWIRLAKADRQSEPNFERIRRDDAPVRRERGAVARLYSGTTGDVRSATRNLVPTTLVDIELEAGVVFDQELPASYNGFVYVIDGSFRVGESALRKGQVGWLDRPEGQGASNLRFEAGSDGVRIVLYAGEPQRDPTIQHGPFVAGSAAEIQQLFAAYHAGTFTSMSALSRARQA